MQNIRLTLQYDGTRYLGWQRPKKDGFETVLKKHFPIRSPPRCRG